MTADLPCPRVLTIAGSDSGAGAGIQADIKTVAALGGYALCAVTAVTVQNTVGVRAVAAMSPGLIADQCAAVLDDVRVDAVKIGMLADAGSVAAVAGVLRRYRPPLVVLDPVLSASSGAGLAQPETVAALCTQLLPLVDVLTPNWHEAARLCGEAPAADEVALQAQGRRLQAMGARTVLLKGGHGPDVARVCDWLLDEAGVLHAFSGSRIHSPHTHGTGCTLAAAIATLYPREHSIERAVALAQAYVRGAIAAARHWRLGRGSGPLAHFWLWD